MTVKKERRKSVFCFERFVAPFFFSQDRENQADSQEDHRGRDVHDDGSASHDPR